MKLYHSSVRTQCSGRPAVEGFFRSSMSTVAWTIAEWFVNRAQSASPYQGQVPSVATSPAARAAKRATPALDKVPKRRLLLFVQDVARGAEEDTLFILGEVRSAEPTGILGRINMETILGAELLDCRNAIRDRRMAKHERLREDQGVDFGSRQQGL